MSCKMCGMDVEKCLFVRKKIINDKEYYFCCEHCAEEFENQEEKKIS